MWDYPIGTQRFTEGGTLGKAGKAKRVFWITSLCHASSSDAVTLYNGTSAASTVNAYWTHQGIAGSGNSEEIGWGILMPAGCYIGLGATSGVSYALVGYRESMM